MSAKFEVYLDQANEYRWRLKARNGEIVAVSGEGFSSSRAAQASTQVVRSCSTDALLEVLPPPVKKEAGEVQKKLAKLKSVAPSGSSLVKPAPPTAEATE